MLYIQDLTRLIPQRPPIVMVDCLLHIQDNVSTTQLTIKNDNIFVQDGRFQESGIIEHIAQSAAARIGYLYANEGKPVPQGYIGSVDNFELFALPETGQQLTTTITVLQEVSGITLISADVTVEEKSVARCRMKIFISPKDEEKA